MYATESHIFAALCSKGNAFSGEHYCDEQRDGAAAEVWDVCGFKLHGKAATVLHAVSNLIQKQLLPQTFCLLCCNMSSELHG